MVTGAENNNQEEIENLQKLPRLPTRKRKQKNPLIILPKDYKKVPACSPQECNDGDYYKNKDGKCIKKNKPRFRICDSGVFTSMGFMEPILFDTTQEVYCNFPVGCYFPQQRTFLLLWKF